MEISDSEYNKIRSKYNPHIPPLKKVYKRAGFFNYYFFQRKKIKKWNNDNDLIIFKKFDAQITLTSNFKAKLDTIFIDYFHKLNIHIKSLISIGWKMNFISIYEYNMLINFKKFYDRFYQVVKSDELVKDEFLQLERAYVKITYRHTYVDTIISIFEKYLISNNSKYNNNPDKYDTLIENIRHLFAKNSLPHSLRELILAYNVSELRIFYRWGDIFPPISTDIVQKEWYNCDREIYTNLIKYYKNIMMATKALSNEKEQLLRLKNNCILNKSDSPPILVNFYEKEGHSWTLDNSNYYLLFLLLNKGFLSMLDIFIFREWEIIDDRENKSNRRLITDEELPGMYQKLKREIDMAFVYFNSDSSPGITVEEYRSHENPEIYINSEYQKKMFYTFNEIITIIFDISYKILSYCDLAIESGYTKNGFLKYMIDTPNEWRGKPVFSLFNHYVELLWTTCGFFNHKKFRHLEARLIEIDKNLAELNSEQNRIDAFDILKKTVNKVEE